MKTKDPISSTQSSPNNHQSYSLAPFFSKEQQREASFFESESPIPQVFFQSKQNISQTESILQQETDISEEQVEKRELNIQNKADTQIQRQIYGKNPTGKSNPKAIIPIKDFITYVEDVERSYSKDSNTDIITRIRQLYYSGMAFDRLIPGAAREESVKRSPNFGNDYDPIKLRQRTVYKGEVNADTYSHLTARADENTLGDNPSPYIKLSNGQLLDVGHLLLGLDALIHPSTSAPYTTYQVPNIDPASWVADLGIAAVWMEYHEKEGKPHSDVPRKISKPNLTAYYKMSAPEEDLIGDVDSFGLFSAHQQSKNSSLSQLLKTYYLGQNAKVESRWQNFCQANQFHYHQKGNSIVWKSGVRAFYITRINRFNDLYAGGTWGAIKSVLKFWTTPKREKWKYTPAVLSRFMKFVKRNLEQELNKP